MWVRCVHGDLVVFKVATVDRVVVVVVAVQVDTKVDITEDTVTVVHLRSGHRVWLRTAIRHGTGEAEVEKLEVDVVDIRAIVSSWKRVVRVRV